MASIFLSYARDDMPKAKALAKALERAGHSVWWDRHLRGGSEFAGEIEGALKRADMVLVLWSETSISSAWVRDEAAEGRDTGRLLPVMLDDCVPPLGFRQIHSISVAGWSGRGNPPNFADILAAVGHSKAEHKEAPEGRTARSRLLARPLILAVAVLALVLAATGAWFLLAKRGGASDPVLAVLPFSDLSPERDKAYFAEGVAEAILTVLAKEPGIRVIGRSTAQQLHNAGDDSERMRRALGVTHVLEGSARSAGDQLRMSVRLIDASDGQQLWAEEYQRRLDNIFAVQDEIGRAVAQRLKGSFAPAQRAAQQLTAADTYTLYLAARAKMRDRRMSSLQHALRLARQVIAADPEYAPGHALYAELLLHMSDQHYGTFPHSRARDVAQQHARRAIRLAPQAAEGHAALGLTSDPNTAVVALERAIRLDPGRAELRLWLAMSLNKLGRHQEALEHVKRAVELEPLWMNGVSRYTLSLTASDRHAEAEQVVAKFEQRGGRPADAARIRGDMAYFRGDFSEALRLTRLAIARDPETPFAGRRLGQFYAMVGLPAQAAATSRRLPLYTRLFRTNEQHRLADEIRRAGRTAWDQPDIEVGVRALAVARDWALIERLYNQLPGGAATLCREYASSTTALDVATALRHRNRSAESGRVLECLKQTLAVQSRGSVRSVDLPGWQVDMGWAQVHALEGRPDRAFARVQSAIGRGYRTRYGRGLSDLPAFDPFRTDPLYARLDARLKQLMARERAQVLQASGRA